METVYTSYTKMVDGASYYFVKKFLSFPELPGVPPILESYGMHTDFDRACSLAAVTDKDVKKVLFSETEVEIRQAKVIEINKPDAGGFLAVGY